jgi:adenosylcobinamide-GDP ribazoletransferase
MKYLRLAISFLTILPAGSPQELKPGDLGRSAVWFPLVGALIGGIVAGAKWLSDMALPPLLSASLCVALWILLGGALHLDGLADCYDGLFHPSSPQRRLEILQDPHLGTFGVCGLVFHLIIKVITVAYLPADTAWLAILTAACLSRWLILLVARQPSARPEGLGADFSAGLSNRLVILAAILPILLLIPGGWSGFLAAGFALLLTFGIILIALKQLGGVTGDVLGLTVEMTELVTLIVFVAQIPVSG